MRTENVIRFFFRILQIKIFKFFFRIIETIVVWYYIKSFKKKRKIDGKFFRFIQLFSEKLHTIKRRKNHEILIENLDLNLEFDRKIYKLAYRSYAKIFEINESDVKSAVGYFHNQKIYDSHIPFIDAYPTQLIGMKDFLNDKKYHYGSFDIQTSLNCNVVKKFCCTDLLWKIARKYLNTNHVEIYSINTMLSKQSETKNYVVNFHQDFDSASSLTFFVYWTDVTKFNGATRLMPGSHLFTYDRRLPSYIGEPLIDYLEGKSGSIFAVDTWAYHAGNLNLTSPRLTTWIRFTSMPSAKHYRDKDYLFKKNLDEINNAKKF